MNILSVDRTYRLLFQFGSSFFHVDVFFSRSAPSLFLDISNKLEIEVKFVSKFFSEPKKSAFVDANLFLDSFEDSKLTVNNQFVKIRNKTCQMISNENLILRKVKLDNREFYQKLQLYAFYNNDVVYVHAERHYIDIISKRKHVICVGLEIFIDRGKHAS